ncbi:hypothetical protein [Tuwongella immobilis]|uniref:Uncharacterized protein n=1 Tax=Tuwongella immobilis TaxID=692036 RepID=A0A6C2YPR4_9BACT|nr:hypothetical protein [Tuwongella immobilis]VIP03015.1 unnamed protein product [Tuwongella immobilis]VTS03132.1 unnamed protein product [Tuwongella immobilis]
MSESAPKSGNEAKPTPRRRPKVDRSELPLKAYLPEKNRPARWAYQSLIYSLIPGLGVLFPIPAMVFGLLGWLRSRGNAEDDGNLHARVAMFASPVILACQAGGWWLVADGLGWFD